VRFTDVIKDDRDKKTIVAMGRMRHQKGFDLLLKAFASCSNPEWRLVIFGEGQERKGFELLIRELGLEGKVFMPGVVKDSMSLLKQADLFVMSSRFEGFPNALLEAMACGLPVISFDCPSGPGEIIRNGVDGLLVAPEDVNAMADAMKRLMADGEERKRLGTRAIEVLDRFGIEKVMKKWEELLQ
jgi:glycosyltransferase involved in cell wall biosynthesis